MANSVNSSDIMLFNMAKQVEEKLNSGDLEFPDFSDAYFTYSLSSLLETWTEYSAYPDDYLFYDTVDEIGNELKLSKERIEELKSKIEPSNEELLKFAELRDIEPKCSFQIAIDDEKNSLGYALFDYAGGGQWCEITLIEVFNNLHDLKKYVQEEMWS